MRLSQAKVRSTTQRPGKQNKAPGGVGALDDFEVPVAVPDEGLGELVAGISAVGEDVGQPGIEPAGGLQHERGTIAILNVGWMHDGLDQKPLVSVRTWRFRPLIFLPASYPRGPPACVVLTRLAIDHPGAG